MPSSEAHGTSAHGPACDGGRKIQVALTTAKSGGDGEHAIRGVKARYHRARPADLCVRRTVVTRALSMLRLESVAKSASGARISLHGRTLSLCLWQLGPLHSIWTNYMAAEEISVPRCF